ncbi:MAG: 1-acyl-sn-glycerol-3-phosphate acyltransferase [Mycoplasmataceae bacterium]|nr:1-acyl-sn-glycerol-3-phosphate acyltransferase [Mycoplasmataceae bacterium]
MKINLKAAFRKPLWDSRAMRCKRIVRKMDKDPERFTLQWRNDLISKYSSKMLSGFNINVKVTGIENLGKTGPALLIGNHQDTSDALIVLKALEKISFEKEEKNKIATFVAKHDLKYHNLIRYPLELIDVFFLEQNDFRKSFEIYRDFGKFIKNNKTYGIVFPEGTRNREGNISEFKSASLKIAQKELLPIIPFTINNSVRGLDWTRTEELNTEIIFHKKIPASSFINQSTQALSERVYKIIKSSFIPPLFKVKDMSQVDKQKLKSKEEAYYKRENKRNSRELKQKTKIQNQEIKIKKQEESETQRFIESEKKRKEKTNNKKKDNKE